jgi:hypothetical protein
MTIFRRSRFHRFSALVPAAALASLACSLLGRASSAPAATESPEPSATAAPRSASEQLEAALPSTVAGIQVTTLSWTGDDLDASDPAVSSFLGGLEADPSEVDIAASFAADESGLVFQAGAVRIPGRDWSGALGALAASGETDPAVAWEWTTLAGRSVLRGQASGDPSAAPIYYLVSGETLFAVQSSEAGAAETTVENLPPETETGSGSASSLPPPGSGPLVLIVVQRPLSPVCVGAPPGRQRLMVMALDAVLGGVPTPFNTFSVTGLVMSTQGLPPFQFGPVLDQPYSAERYGGGREHLTIEARAPLGGYGIALLEFPVQHCLDGTWQDDKRVLHIAPPGVSAFTADVKSGTLCEEERGVAFSGKLEVDQVSGSNLTTCNPEVCVEAGLLESSVNVPYTGVVADDGMSITIDWVGDFFQFEEDSQGNVVSCTKTSVEEHKFTITRLTFGD